MKAKVSRSVGRECIAILRVLTSMPIAQGVEMGDVYAKVQRVS